MPETLACAAEVASLLRRASARLGSSETPRLDAEILLANALGVDRAALYRAPERQADAGVVARFEADVDARAAGTPVAYLTGRTEFWSLTLKVSPAVLIPRPETELLVEQVLRRCAQWPAPILADLGTGSGAIAAALAQELPRAQIVALERSAAAAAVARANFVRLGFDNVSMVQGDWLGALKAESFDVIAANPPYVAPAERATLAPALAHEPAAALFAGDDGLADLRSIIAGAAAALKPGGWLMVEHGAAQGVASSALFKANGYNAITTHRDIAGLERVTSGRVGG